MLANALDIIPAVSTPASAIFLTNRIVVSLLKVLGGIPCFLLLARRADTLPFDAGLMVFWCGGSRRSVAGGFFKGQGGGQDFYRVPR